MFSQANRFLQSFASRHLVSLACFLTVSLVLASASSLGAQQASSSLAGIHPPADRLTQPIVESNRVVLAGTTHPLASKANDLGAVRDDMRLDRIQVVLKRTDTQEATLKQLIGDMHSQGSASYHKWLTPETFGKQFGPSEADVAKLESWLGSHGFSITKMNPGRQTLEIAGTAGQFRDTFHTQIHSYKTKGAAGGFETHFANSSAPEIPAAIAPVFGGFASLNNFHLKNDTHVVGKAQYNPATHEAKPDWTYGSGSRFTLLVAPSDFAVQYDLNPLYAAGTKGDGQSIAIVNETNINVALVNNYRSLFGLPVNPPQVVIDGNDPGIDGVNSPYGPNGASIEAYLDVEVAGAVAPNAQINLVIADSTALQDGLALAAERAVYSNISPVISLSFGNCEASLQSGNAFWSNLWEQAAAQGITVMVSTGDSGSAACDNDNTQQFAVFGQAVNGIASTPYNVAVGGTDFYYSGGSASFANYWNNLASPTTNAASVSLAKKIPEQPFNSSQYGLNIYPESDSSGTSIFAAGGGPSTLGLAGTSPYPKPSWQTGVGVPADHVRDIPDVSLFGSLDTNGSITPICSSDGDCETPASVVQLSGVGGTSVSAPEFAGIMALVNQKYGRQGQANYVLYPLAAQFPAAFNDVTAGTNSVPCAYSSANFAAKDCQSVSNAFTIDDNTYGTAVEGEIGFTANTPAYNAATGYDLATGLGTVDANNLVTNWGSVTFGASTTTLTPSSTSFAHGSTVTISGSVTGASPSGDVALVTTSTDASAQAKVLFPLAGGSYSADVNTLPGGTYNISGYYGGDGSNAPSASTPVSITVTPETSKTLLQIFSAADSSLDFKPIASNSFAYGTPLLLSAQPTNSAGTVSTTPTGSVIFSDGATALGTSVVNAEGDAEVNRSFAPGTHTITAAYSGDSSYGSSNSSAISFLISKATPTITAINYDTDQRGYNIVSANGTFFTVLVENANAYSGVPIAAPTGTITLAGGPSGTTTSATLTAGIDPNNRYPAGIAIFKVPAGASLGNYTFNFSYALGDSNYNSVSRSFAETLTSYTGGLASSTTATATATSTSPSSAVQVTATVTGQTGNGAPTGNVYLVSSGADGYLKVASLPTSSGLSSTVTFKVDSGSLYPGTNQITVQYFGDTSYYPSATTVTIANPLSDFSLVPLTTIVNVPGTGASAGVQTDTINLNSYKGFSGAVSLTCSAPTGITCALSSNSVTLAGGGSGSTTLSVDTSAVTTAGTYDVVVTGTDSTGNLVHTIGLQVVTPIVTLAPGFKLAGTAVSISAPGGSGTSTITATPVGGFTGTVALTCTLTGPAAATDPPTCSAASANITGTTAANATLTFSTLSTTTAGAYTATVTGTSGNLVVTTVVGVTVTGAVVTPGAFSLAGGPGITIASPGLSGTSTVTLTNTAGGPVTVSLACAVTTSMAGAINLPTCGFGISPVTVSAPVPVLAVLTVNTTAQTTSRLSLPQKGIFTVGGGVTLAALLFFGVPVGRRGRNSLRALRTLRILSVALLFAMLAGSSIGCGGGSSSGGGGTPTPTGGTTTGAYVVTVTATPASGTVQTATVAVTVN